MRDAQFLGREPIGRLLWKLSLPAAVGMIVNALYNMVDAVFVGQGPGPLGLAGLSIAFPIQMLANAVALTIGVGTAALISIRLGEKKTEEAARIAGSSQISSFLAALVFLLILGFFLDPILKAFGANEAILPYARDYVGTVMWGFPLVASLMVGNNILRAEGKAHLSMTIMLLSTCMNMILDPIFIFPKGEFLIGYFGMGIQGAALATVISQGSAFILLVILYLRKTSSLPLKLHYFFPRWNILSQASLLGFPTFIRNAGTSLLVLIVNHSLIHYGNALYVSSYGIVNRLMMFSLMPLFGIVQGFQPIAGYNFGAGKYSRVKEVLYKAILTATVLSLFSFFLMFGIPHILLRLFTDDPQLLEQTSHFLRRMVLFFPLLGFQFMGASYFQSIGKKAPSILLGTLRQFLLLPPLVLVLPLIFQLEGISMAFPLSDLLATLITFIVLRRELKKLDHDLVSSVETEA